MVLHGRNCSTPFPVSNRFSVVTAKEALISTLQSMIPVGRDHRAQVMGMGTSRSKTSLPYCWCGKDLEE